MKNIFKTLVLCLLFINSLYANEVIDATAEEIVFLKHSQVYFDKKNKETIDTLMGQPNLFTPYNKEYMNIWLHYQNPIWIKVTFFNPTSKTLHRTLGFDEYFLENIELYITKNDVVLEKKRAGYLHRQKFNGIIQSHFQLEIPSHTKMTYYIKVFTPSYPTSFKCTLFSDEKFIYDDIKYHVVLALFICILVTVCLYNFILFFLTKDGIYFYYALYILGILAAKRVHFLITLYLFPMENLDIVEKEISLIIYGTNFTALTMILFTQHFLKTKAYPKIHKSLNFFIGLILIHSIVTSSTFLTYSDIAFFYLFIIVYLFYIGFYALYKKNKNALYFVFGWGLSVLAWINTILNSMNIWNSRYEFYYITETLIVIEVFIFSYVIAKYIKELNNDKEQLAQSLIEQKENEKLKLKKRVEEKTKDLNKELKTNQFLLQELNHRVKNNMQFITSLYSLKLSNSNESNIQERLEDVQRKVHAMSQLHELLYSQVNLRCIDATKYFKTIVQTIKNSFQSDKVSFIFNINSCLEIEEAIYCGLIVNELVTNAVKYAFEKEEGEVIITLSENEQYKYLRVKDNGVGMKPNSPSNGFGQTLIEILAVEQLGGEVKVTNKHGTEIQISFKKQSDV